MNRALFLLVFSGILFTTTQMVNSQTWTTYFEDSSTKIEYNEQQCSPLNNGISSKYYLIKITNKTLHEIIVSWDLQAYYNEVCKTCNNNEYHFSTKISGNGIAEMNCGDYTNPALAIFKEWTNNSHVKNKEILTKFELVNIGIQ